MKNIPSALVAHLDENITNVAHLVKITRQDNVVVGLTDHDEDIVVEDVIYHADAGMTEKLFSVQSDLKAAENDVWGILGSDLITENDLTAGFFDHAQVDFAICNWRDVTQGVLWLHRGWLGAVVLRNGSYQATFRGMCDCLQRQIGQIYTPECRFDLGDVHCGIDLQAASVIGSVTSILSDISFVDIDRTENTGYFNYGTLVWTSGAMKGVTFDVQNWDLATKTITLWLSGALDVVVGDTYRLMPGCDHRYLTCLNRFSNVRRFGGFPHLAGLSKILQYPESS